MLNVGTFIGEAIKAINENKFNNLNKNNSNSITHIVPNISKNEINEIDKIQYLFFDLNYSIGYNDYKDNEVLTAGYPKGKKLAAGAGIIKEIMNEYEFYHNIPTEQGSSGSPIILFNTLKVIGIHKQADVEEMLNVGTFIGEAIKAINENKFKNVNNNNSNSITHKISNKNEINCIYIVKKNEEINLLYDFTENDNNFNYEESKRAHNDAKKVINMENIDIYINNRKIKFNQKYKSNETGLINVKFKFKKLLTSTGFMFYKCTALKSIDLSLFNTSNIINMYSMFFGCSSLESINLSSFNTNNIIIYLFFL
jgi:surface protein